MKEEEKSRPQPQAPAVVPAMSAEQFSELVRALQPPSPLSGLSPEKRAAVMAPQIQREWRLISCLSPWTGATFDAKVLRSRVHAEGRIVELHNYRHPMSIYKTVSNGGATPDGMPIFQHDTTIWTDLDHEPPKQALTVLFLQYRYEDFLKKDLRMIVGDGKPNEGGMKSAYCVRPDGISTPWRLGDGLVV